MPARAGLLRQAAEGTRTLDLLHGNGTARRPPAVPCALVEGGRMSGGPVSHLALERRCRAALVRLDRVPHAEWAPDWKPGLIAARVADPVPARVPALAVVAGVDGTTAEPRAFMLA